MFLLGVFVQIYIHCQQLDECYLEDDSSAKKRDSDEQAHSQLCLLHGNPLPIISTHQQQLQEPTSYGNLARLANERP
jgi:hypothetical protein